MDGPFGEDLTCTGADESPVHFTGQEHDTESGLEHFPFRYYGSTMARFMTPDPAETAAVDIENPQSWNRYAYVINNPLNYTDPSGLRYEGHWTGENCTQDAGPCSMGQDCIVDGAPTSCNMISWN